jgi:xylulokinase
VSGRAEADPEAWWAAVCTVLRRIASRTGLDGIAGIGVVGQAPTAVLVDVDAKPVRPAILWLDVRADEEARAIESRLGPGGAEAIGGNRSDAYFLGPKLAWLKAHEPRALEAAALVVSSHTFVVLRLTGDLTHGRAELYRALMEGIALGFKHAARVAEENGVRLTEVIATNGAGRSGALRQILCDALGVPLGWVDDATGTARGAAALAALGTGIVSDLSALRVWFEGAARVKHFPHPRSAARLERLFARHLSLYDALQTEFSHDRPFPARHGWRGPGGFLCS